MQIVQDLPQPVARYERLVPKIYIGHQVTWIFGHFYSEYSYMNKDKMYTMALNI